MAKINRLDTVILKAHPDPEDLNHKAKVWEVNHEERKVLVSNQNMPFSGTYPLHWVSFNDIEFIT